MRRHTFYNQIFCLVTLLLTSACAHSITIVSAPANAEVYLLNEKGEAASRLGQTPYTMTTSGRAIRVQKYGYMPATIVFPVDQSLEGQISVALNPLTQDELRKALLEIDPTLLNEMLGELFDLQTAITERRNKDAEAIIKRNQEKMSSISFFHVLVGNYYYRSKNLKAARDSYNQALAVDPKNQDARAMLNLLKGVDK